MKLLKQITLSNMDHDYSQSMSAVIEYYSKFKCKAQSGFECDYLGYCVYCGNLDFNEDTLRCIDDVSAATFRYNRQIHLQLIGPSDSLYDSRFYSMVLEVPETYPQQPPIAYFESQVYHINVDQDSY